MQLRRKPTFGFASTGPLMADALFGAYAFRHAHATRGEGSRLLAQLKSLQEDLAAVVTKSSRRGTP